MGLSADNRLLGASSPDCQSSSAAPVRAVLNSAQLGVGRRKEGCLKGIILCRLGTVVELARLGENALDGRRRRPRGCRHHPDNLVTGLTLFPRCCAGAQQGPRSLSDGPYGLPDGPYGRR